MDLQDTFFLVGIIYMIFMMLVVVAVGIAALVIKSKISRVVRRLNQKLQAAQNVADRLVTILRTMRYFAKR